MNFHHHWGNIFFAAAHQIFFYQISKWLARFLLLGVPRASLISVLRGGRGGSPIGNLYYHRSLAWCCCSDVRLDWRRPGQLSHLSWSVGNCTWPHQLVHHLVDWIHISTNRLFQYLLTWSDQLVYTASTNWWDPKRMAANNGSKQKKPPSAIALAVSVAAASQMPVLSLIKQAETSMDSEKEALGRWAATVGHMEEILQSDPDHGHALMVTLLCFILSSSKALWNACWSWHDGFTWCQKGFLNIMS